jgi:curli biogenesis system outer membrane secretion channel CsgG
MPRIRLFNALSFIVVFGISAFGAGAPAKAQESQGSPPPAQSATYTGPRLKIAVLNFSTRGLTSNWFGQFEPGVALSDLVTDELVNKNEFNVLDRTHIDSTLSEHQLAASGEVDPQTAISAGHLTGARYLVVGNILQLDQTGRSGGGLGGLMPGILGAAAGAISTHRVTIKVAVHVVDALTGQIVQSFQDEETRKGTSWGAAGITGTAGAYAGNSQFINSDMGHLIDDEAQKIAATIDPARFNAGPVAPTLNGHIAAIDGSNIIINLGGNAGVQVGQYFDIIKLKSIVDPGTHSVLTVSENMGKLQIDSVSPTASVAHVISGKAAVRLNVTSEPMP